MTNYMLGGSHLFFSLTIDYPPQQLLKDVLRVMCYVLRKRIRNLVYPVILSKNLLFVYFVSFVVKNSFFFLFLAIFFPFLSYITNSQYNKLGV